MSENFSLGSLADWHEVHEGEIIAFDLPSSGSRAADFSVMCDDVCSVIASDSADKSYLVGFGSGLLNIKFSMSTSTAITFARPSGASVFIRSRALSQEYSDGGEASFTNLEPQWMEQSEKISRVQQLMALNAERRVQRLLEGLEQREKVFAARTALAEAVLDPTKPDPASDGA